MLDHRQEALDRVYDAAFDDLALDGLARSVSLAVGVDHASVSVRRGLEIVAHSITAPPADSEAYAAHYWRLDPWTPALLALPPGRFAFGDELVAQEALDRSREFVVDFAAPTGVVFPLCGWLPLDDGASLSVGIGRTDSMKPFSEDERRATTDVVHHVRRAVQLRRRLQAAQARTGIARSALDAVAFGLALVEADGRVAVANAAFEEMARSGVGIRIAGGRLSSHGVAVADPLVRMVAKAARSRISGACRLEGPAGAALSVIVVPASPSNPFGVFSGRHALVAVSPPHAPDPATAELLAQLFGLSSAEAEVAASLWAGASPQEIAAARGVKLTTLKTQFDAIYRKTGAGNQQALLRLLGSLPRVR